MKLGRHFRSNNTVSIQVSGKIKNDNSFDLEISRNIPILYALDSS